MNFSMPIRLLVVQVCAIICGLYADIGGNILHYDSLIFGLYRDERNRSCVHLTGTVLADGYRLAAIMDASP